MIKHKEARLHEEEKALRLFIREKGRLGAGRGLLSAAKVMKIPLWTLEDKPCLSLGESGKEGITYIYRVSLVAQTVKNLPIMQEIWV